MTLSRALLRAVTGSTVLVAAGLLPCAPAWSSAGIAPRAASFGTALVGSAPAGRGASAVAVDPVTQTVYVGNGNNVDGPNAGGDTVSVIDTRRCHAADVHRCAGPWPTVTVGALPTAIAVDPRTHTVYVASGADHTVSVVDGTTCNGHVVTGCGHVAATVAVGDFPVSVLVDPVSRTVYVPNLNDGTVSLLDAARCNGRHPGGCPTGPAPTFAVPGSLSDVDVNQRTRTGYVTTFTGLVAFDARTCNAGVRSGCGSLGVRTLCTDCFGSFSATVDEATNTIYEGDGDHSIAAVDGRTCNAADLAGCATARFGTVSVPAPGYEHILWLAVDPALHSLYALMHKDDQVLVIDTAECNGTRLDACAAVQPASVHTGTNPESLGLDPRTQTLYVANELDGAVAVVDASRCSAAVRSGCRVRPAAAAVADAGEVAVDPATRTAYVTSSPDRVAMIDTTACTAHRPQGCRAAPPTVAVGDVPQAVAVDGSTHTVYVAGHGTGTSGTVAVLDTRRCNAHPVGCRPTATVAVPAGNPTDIAVDARTHTVVVGTATAGGTNLLSVLDGADCNATRTTGCGRVPAVMPIGPERPAGTPPFCSFLGVAVDDVTHTVYATDTETQPCGDPAQSRTVYLYDAEACLAAAPAGCAAVGTVATGVNPFQLAVDPTTSTVYAPLLADGEAAGGVAVIDGTHCNRHDVTGCSRTPPVVPAGFGSKAATVDERSHTVYVTADQDASVTVIRTRPCPAASRCVADARQLPADDYPVDVAVDPAAGTVYSSSAARGAVSVLPAGHCRGNVCQDGSAGVQRR